MKAIALVVIAIVIAIAGFSAANNSSSNAVSKIESRNAVLAQIQ